MRLNCTECFQPLPVTAARCTRCGGIRLEFRLSWWERILLRFFTY